MWKDAKVEQVFDLAGWGVLLLLIVWPQRDRMTAALDKTWNVNAPEFAKMRRRFIWH